MTEAVWTYEISVEKILKRLVDKEIFTQEHTDYMSERLFEQLNLLDVPGALLSSIWLYEKVHGRRAEYLI